MKCISIGPSDHGASQRWVGLGQAFFLEVLARACSGMFQDCVGADCLAIGE